MLIIINIYFNNIIIWSVFQCTILAFRSNHYTILTNTYFFPFSLLYIIAYFRPYIHTFSDIFYTFLDIFLIFLRLQTYFNINSRIFEWKISIISYVKFPNLTNKNKGGVKNRVFTSPFVFTSLFYIYLALRRQHL